MLSDIAIARAARLKPIAEIASKIEIPEDALYPYGRSIAKIEAEFLSGLAHGPSEGSRRQRTVFLPMRHEGRGGRGRLRTGPTRRIAQEIYGADDVAADDSVRARFGELEAAGFGRLPICVAKTQYSFSDNPALLGAPAGHSPTVREIRLRAGAGFVVVLMGDIRTMPGLPRSPAAERIRVVDGEIEGLF